MMLKWLPSFGFVGLPLSLSFYLSLALCVSITSASWQFVNTNMLQTCSQVFERRRRERERGRQSPADGHIDNFFFFYFFGPCGSRTTAHDILHSMNYKCCCCSCCNWWRCCCCSYSYFFSIQFCCLMRLTKRHIMSGRTPATATWAQQVFPSLSLFLLFSFCPSPSLSL